MTRKPIVTRFHLFALGVLIAVTATSFIKIPAGTDLPIHWAFDGKPDQFWPRVPALLVFPVIGILLTGLFALIGRFAPVERIEPGRHVSEAMLTGLLGLACALQFSLMLIGMGADLDMVRIICFAMAAFLVVLGNVLPKSQRNSYSGLRLPWTLNDAANWRASHWVTGMLYLAGGLGLALVAWLRPDPPSMLAALGVSIFVPIVVGAIFSFVRSKF